MINGNFHTRSLGIPDDDGADGLNISLWNPVQKPSATRFAIRDIAKIIVNQTVVQFLLCGCTLASKSLPSSLESRSSSLSRRSCMYSFAMIFSYDNGFSVSIPVRPLYQKYNQWNTIGGVQCIELAGLYWSERRGRQKGNRNVFSMILCEKVTAGAEERSPTFA